MLCGDSVESEHSESAGQPWRGKRVCNYRATLNCFARATHLRTFARSRTDDATRRASTLTRVSTIRRTHSLTRRPKRIALDDLLKKSSRVNWAWGCSCDDLTVSRYPGLRSDTLVIGSISWARSVTKQRLRLTTYSSPIDAIVLALLNPAKQDRPENTYQAMVVLRFKTYFLSLDS